MHCLFCDTKETRVVDVSNHTMTDSTKFAISSIKQYTEQEPCHICVRVFKMRSLKTQYEVDEYIVNKLYKVYYKANLTDKQKHIRTNFISKLAYYSSKGRACSSKKKLTEAELIQKYNLTKAQAREAKRNMNEEQRAIHNLKKREYRRKNGRHESKERMKETSRKYRQSDEGKKKLKEYRSTRKYKDAKNLAARLRRQRIKDEH